MNKHQHSTFFPNAVDKRLRGEINSSEQQHTESPCLCFAEFSPEIHHRVCVWNLSPDDMRSGYKVSTATGWPRAGPPPCWRSSAGWAGFFFFFFGPINAADIIWQIQTSPVGWRQALAEIQALYSIIRASRSLEYDRRTNTALQHWADDQVFFPSRYNL